jgi:hypothetical protein
MHLESLLLIPLGLVIGLGQLLIVAGLSIVVERIVEKVRNHGHRS